MSPHIPCTIESIDLLVTGTLLPWHTAQHCGYANLVCDE